MPKVNKPQKPNKIVEQPGSMTFYFDHSSNKVSLDYFNQWVKDNLPKGAYDVSLSLDEEYDHYSGEIMTTNLQVEYLIKVDNAKYDSQMKKYQKQLAKWNEQCQKS